MALTAKFEEQDAAGEEAVFSVKFTNGTLKQLKDLADFLKSDGFSMPEDETDKLKEVVSIGIAWLESVKERRKKDKTEGV